MTINGPQFNNISYFAKVLHVPASDLIEKFMMSARITASKHAYNSDLFECETNIIPILMHQMHISTNQVSSVVLRPKNLEIQKQF
jgi:hypothetical protein